MTFLIAPTSTPIIGLGSWLEQLIAEYNHILETPSRQREIVSEELDEIDLPPFRRAVEDGVLTLHVADTLPARRGPGTRGSRARLGPGRDVAVLDPGADQPQRGQPGGVTGLHRVLGRGGNAVAQVHVVLVQAGVRMALSPAVNPAARIRGQAASSASALRPFGPLDARGPRA